MARPVDEALIGRTIARKFVVESFLGGGATGAVYRGKQLSLDKPVAIKVLHPDLSDPSFVARFQREAQAASKLDHPNSMRVLDYGREPDGLCYIAMELLEGKSLFRVLRDADGPLSDGRTVSLTRQILAALAAAHDMGVIHRDLKPENIIVVQTTSDNGRVSERVKVCDFGMAKMMTADARTDKAAEKLSSAGVVFGTPEYMSPEQGKGEDLDGRSDLYSVGIMLYQMLTGRLPFEADTHIATLVKHLVEAPTPPSQVHPDVHLGLEAVCLRAIQKDREKRFGSAREMRTALRQALELDSRPSLVSSVSSPESSANLPESREPMYSAPDSSLLEPVSVVAAPLPRRRALEMLDSSSIRKPRRSKAGLFFALLIMAGGGVFAARRLHPPRAPPMVVAGPASAEAPPPPPVAPPPSAPPPPAPVVEAPAPSIAASGSARASVDAQAPFAAVPGRPGKPFEAPGMPGAAASHPKPASSIVPWIVLEPADPPGGPPAAAPPPGSANGFERASVSFGLVRANQAGPADVVAAMPSGRFTECYRQELKARGGSLGGSGTLHLLFGSGGHVTEAAFQGPPSLALVGKCIADVAAASTIRNVQSSAGGAEVDLSFKQD